MGTHQDCDVDRMLSHGGGLPGYGSFLVMWPDYGVGVVALANATYAVPARPAVRAFAALRKMGAVHAKKPVPAPALLAAQSAVDEAIARRDPAPLARAAANNLMVDQALDKRRAALASLSAHGVCRADGPLDAENALRGRWRLACDKGWILPRVTLAPTVPPSIQSLDIDDGFEPSERMMRAAQAVVALFGRVDDAALAALLAPSANAERVKAAISAAASSRLACTLGRAEAGDGAASSTFHLACERGPLRMKVDLDDASGKIKEIAFSPLPSERCGGFLPP
jgi:hypothetical protein